MTELTMIADALNGLHITIHTDGAAYRNPGPGGWGAVLCRMEGSTELKRRITGGFDASPDTTNIRMEMTAVAAGLEAIRPGEPQPILVRPDLEIIVKGMTEWMPGWIARGWRTSKGKPVDNVDLWQRIASASEGKTVNWLWVRGHAGDERNELAHSVAAAQMHKAIAATFSNAA